MTLPPSPQAAANLKIPQAANGYRQWVSEQGVAIESGNYQLDLNQLELSEWPQLGGAGVILNHDKSNASNDCWVVDILPGGSLVPEKHLFEKMVYVLAGRGATRVWAASGDEQVFEWQEGSLFALPLNAKHQHFNADGASPARLLMVTNAPVLMNMFQSEAFVFGCDHVFAERFAGEAGYFDGSGSLDGRMWTTNFIADVRSFELLDYPERGGGGRNMQLTLAGNSMKAHISEFAVGGYKKAHRHGPGAHVLVLSGTGFSLMWPEGQRPKRYDWRPGSLIVPPDNWFHQHFNTGATPARYLALRYMDTRTFNADGVPLTNVSTRLGGNQIEYEDEAPEIREMYEAAIGHGSSGSSTS